MSEDLKWDSRVGLCVKSCDMKVQFQNSHSTDVCGNRKGQICEDKCKAVYLEKTAELSVPEGMHFYAAVDFGHGPEDVVLINDGQNIITISYALTKNREVQAEYFKSMKLTPMELKVMSYVGNGFSNVETAMQLGITKSTLRKHLNNIYKKIPKKSFQRKPRTQIKSK